LKAVGSFAAKNVLPVLGPALKQIAKTALPIAGGALGSLIPIPGVGTALGSALGGAVANALEMEVVGLNREDADVERARRFVRLAASAIREAAIALGSAPPERRGRPSRSNFRATLKAWALEASLDGFWATVDSSRSSALRRRRGIEKPPQETFAPYNSGNRKL
jgi:hypothetical protein